MSIPREDEDAVRALLHEHVAQVYATEGLTLRVEAGARRRWVIRRAVLSAAPLLAAGCVAGLVFSIGTGGSAQHTPAARPTITCPTALPDSWMLSGVPATPATAGAAHSLVPGRPVAAVSCAMTAAGRSSALSPKELSSTVAALNSAILASAHTDGAACAAPDQAHGPILLKFAYANGTRLNVAAYATTTCDHRGPVTWHVTNGSTHGTVQSPALDALAAAGSATQSAG